MITGHDAETLTVEKTKVLARTRRSFILDALAETGAVSVTEIAAQLGVSEMTVRRDLTELEKEGRLARTHGGAVSTDLTTIVEPGLSATTSRLNEPTFQARLAKNALPKRLIAEAAARVASGLRTIALDVGTTTFLLARLLAGQQHVKFFTNSVRNATQLGEGLAEVYLPGGRMRNDELSISNATAISQFEALWFDIAFVGVSGLTSDGIYDYSFDDTEMKRVYLRRSTKKVVLCDASKFDCMSLVHIAPLSQFDMLITNASPPPELAKALEAARVEVMVAGASS
ncbi:DeoR family transcriptional regulator [Rhizobium sp. ERR 922]|uniref:DeoR family transcriptional regulator n=1 Tax=Rhizobium dioscoreae TaxID=2653122 RepID=A0ABQ0Z9L7_9HYPH|nr:MULTISPECIES: DeoR/GlpR family DNA-binding transcription regulator [Rhizobium]MCZ3374420.1 DeoR/GlpR transcriptional regulator [Rhizobium sp. AG207R]TWB49032.1 DeoR family transcriptional regulator [Rhizobium sp. ERR 922]TWB91564.1 DeoR family transcriptional regulator [Rhizobium sp. ERR 942]GES52073.1 DeoR family transcriptional regulator [Rhizobium dioscoreae]GLU83208.1 DeoR family transcriptional regulator [Rhizobium sp. NBRC 114257]